MAVNYTLPRGTKAALTMLAAVDGLKVGQAYFLTDENKIAVAKSTNSFEVFVRESDFNFGSLNDVNLSGAQETDFPQLENGVWVAARRRTPPKLPLPSNFYGIPGLVVPISRGGMNLVNDRQYFSPFFVHETETITGGQLVVSTAQEKSNIRAGIVSWDVVMGQADQLVVDFGVVDSSSTGSKDLIGSCVLNGGYWYALTIIPGGGTTAPTIARIYAATVGDCRVTIIGTNINLIDYRYNNYQAAQRTNGFNADQSLALLTANGTSAGILFPFVLSY